LVSTFNFSNRRLAGLQQLPLIGYRPISQKSNASAEALPRRRPGGTGLVFDRDGSTGPRDQGFLGCAMSRRTPRPAANNAEPSRARIQTEEPVKGN
jgi:hypothetical protein